MGSRIIIAGGGTGGHVYPALAIGEALVNAGVDRDDVYFVGSERGIEALVVPEAGYQVVLLPGRGIKRSLSASNIGAVIGLLRGLSQGISLVRSWRPRAVVSVGGYAAAPCGIAAVILGVPLILAESNAVPGAVHRLLSRFARAAAITYPTTPLRNTQTTGNPVRADILAVQRGGIHTGEAKKKLGVSTERVLVGVFGGSLGARSINRAVEELCVLWRDRDDISIYHVVGKRDWKKSMGDPFDGDLEVKRVEYEEHMDVLYSAADVIVCRSGATTSSELSAVGVPSVLIPLPGAPGDHQTANALALQEVGAAELLIDSQCSGKSLAVELEPIVTDLDLREKMAEAARSLGRPNAARDVAALVLKHARP